MTNLRRAAPLLALACILAGAFLVFFASQRPGATSLLQTHSAASLGLGIAAAVLWLAEVQPTWLFFGVVVGTSVALVDLENLAGGATGVALLCVARALQVKFKL